jgi:hypothetical protein
MDRTSRLPDADRLSVLAATILLAYALGRLVDLPGRELALQLPGIYLRIQINVQTFVALLVAGLTATGMDWLLQDHPILKGNTRIQHWLLPALTASVISLPLFYLPIGLLWWIGFALGAILITLVLIAEYIVVDPDDVRQPLAAAGLTAISFALFLVLAATMRITGARLFILLPSLTLAMVLVSLRTLRLRLHSQWAVFEAIVIAMIIAQLTATLHYMPLSPVTFGLLLLGPAYALTNLFGNLAEGDPIRQALIEPVAVLILVYGAAIWIR